MIFLIYSFVIFFLLFLEKYSIIMELYLIKLLIVWNVDAGIIYFDIFGLETFH